MNTEDYFPFEVKYMKEGLIEEGDRTVKMLVTQRLQPTNIYYPATNISAVSLYNFISGDIDSFLVSDQYVGYRCSVFDRASFQCVSFPKYSGDIFEVCKPRILPRYEKRLRDRARVFYNTFTTHISHVPDNFDDFMAWGIYCDFLSEQSLFIIEDRLRKLMKVHPLAFYILLDRRPSEIIRKIIKKHHKEVTDQRISSTWSKLRERYSEECTNAIGLEKQEESS